MAGLARPEWRPSYYTTDKTQEIAQTGTPLERTTKAQLEDERNSLTGRPSLLEQIAASRVVEAEARAERSRKEQLVDPSLGGRVHSPQRPKPSLMDPLFFIHNPTLKGGPDAAAARAGGSVPRAKVLLGDRGMLPIGVNKPVLDIVQPWTPSVAEQRAMERVRRQQAGQHCQHGSEERAATATAGARAQGQAGRPRPRPRGRGRSGNNRPKWDQTYHPISTQWDMCRIGTGCDHSKRGVPVAPAKLFMRTLRGEAPDGEAVEDPESETCPRRSMRRLLAQPSSRAVLAQTVQRRMPSTAALYCSNTIPVRDRRQIPVGANQPLIEQQSDWLTATNPALRAKYLPERKQGILKVHPPAGVGHFDNGHWDNTFHPLDKQEPVGRIGQHAIRPGGLKTPLERGQSHCTVYDAIVGGGDAAAGRRKMQLARQKAARRRRAARSRVGGTLAGGLSQSSVSSMGSVESAGSVGTAASMGSLGAGAAVPRDAIGLHDQLWFRTG